MRFFRLISTREVDNMLESLEIDAQPKVQMPQNDEEDSFCRILLSANEDQWNEDFMDDEYSENSRHC